MSSNHLILCHPLLLLPSVFPSNRVSTRPSRPTTKKKKKDVLFVIGDWNAKVGSKEISGVTGKFGLGVQNDAGQKITEFCQENVLISKNFSNSTRDVSTHEYNQIVNTKIRAIIFFVAEDGEALYSQQKQDQKLTVTQIMNFLL